ncbi:MAG: hypothetical protein FJ191_04290 [Gammaproteobacteria bacterium]|nr:hypothetical protein [Gammaproteobacteria bacterium]
MEYSEEVRRLFDTLPHCGELAAGAGPIVAGEAAELERGAWLRFEARLADGAIVDAAFRAWGCPHTLAAAALTAARLPGWRAGTPPPVDARSLAGELAVPADKLGRLLVLEDALQSLLRRASELQSAPPGG